MIRLITRGRFTPKLVQGNIDAPEDREPALRKLIEAAGAKMIAYYITTGDHDFMLISEANDAESVMAAIMVPAGAGTITETNTISAWTAGEFKAVAEKASKMSGAYRAPGA